MPSITLHAKATETASGNSGAMQVPAQSLVAMFVNVTAMSGTLPTLTLKLRHTPDGQEFQDVQSMTTNALAALGLSQLAPSTNGQKIADEVQLVWTIGGVNPSFEFDVQLEVAP